MKIQNYKQALDYLYKSIPKGEFRYPGELGLTRQRFILNCLNNPQNSYPIIHIAGTSGKGSTASYLSHLLTDHGFKTGLTVSPHIFDIKERIQINNKNISQKDFVLLLNKIIPAIEKTKENGLGNPTYFEILVAIFYFAFYYYKVDYAVIETGMGGLMDGTNIIDSKNKIAVITKLGLDHTRILGNSISKIATQKAGIIKAQNTVLSLWPVKSAKLVIDKAAKDNQSSLSYIKKGINYRNIHLIEKGLTYTYSFQDLVLKKLLLNTIALYQVENSALALSVLKIISNRDNFEINPKIVKKTFSSFKFLGRMDLSKTNNSTIIYDGAHNPQKMSAFIKSLKFSFPQKEFVFVVAFKQKKEAKKMLREIIPIAKKIILTSFVVTDQDMVAISQDQNYLIKILKALNFTKYELVSNPNLAIKKATEESNLVAITGSLYLLNKIYKKA